MDTTLAEVFPAGEHLADELTARGWTQVEFAEILGRPTQFVSEIVQGKKEITRESAAQIGAALGTRAEFWLNLQDSYFFWKQHQDPRAQEDLDEVRLRAKLNEQAPMAVLRKRGVITATTAAGQADQLMRLLEIDDLDSRPR
jgi:HTH-type transcriptional regulator/antitoxin HigA